MDGITFDPEKFGAPSAISLAVFNLSRYFEHQNTEIQAEFEQSYRGDVQMKIRVMVVDEQVSVREMVRALLPREGAYEVVGEAGTGLEAVRLGAKLKPDLIVLDLALPEFNGAGLLRHFREKTPHVRTLVYCGTCSREVILEALRARPHGFVLKRDSYDTFRHALKTVTAGCLYFSSFATNLMDEAAQAGKAMLLTARELSVLQMVAEGMSNKEVAQRLSISAKTVEHHRARLMEKVGVRDVAGLTRYAVRRGLTSLD